MSKQTSPATETMKFTDVRQQLSQLVNEVARNNSRIVIEKNGVPAAVLVSIDDLREILAIKERERERYQAMVDISNAFADVTDEELELELAKAQQAAREAMRANLVASPT